jgi:hypothetical protein
MKRLLICIYSFTIFFTANAQSWTLDLNEQARDDRFLKSQTSIPMFRLLGDSLEENSLEGTTPAKWHPIKKMPDLRDCKDTGYFYIYFNGVPHGVLKNYVAVMVGNYSMRKPMQWWVDYNGNLDFTDDIKEPIQLLSTFKYVDITLVNAANNEGHYTVRLSRLNFVNNTNYFTMLDNYFKKTFPNRRFLGPGYGLKEQQQRIRSTHFKWAKDSFIIGAFDGNNNGIYTESGEDKIVIADYNATTISAEEADGAMVCNGNKTYTFDRRGIRYEVSLANETGVKLNIAVKQEGLGYGLVVGEKFPSFRFKTTRKSQVKTRRYMRWKPTVVHFFNFDDTAKLSDDTAALGAIYRKYGKRIKIICFFYGKKPELLKNYIQFGKIEWLNGYGSKEINHRCKIEKIPSTYYCKRFRRIKLSGTSPKEIYELLEQKKL